VPCAEASETLLTLGTCVTLRVGQSFGDLHYPILVTKTDIENRLVPNDADSEPSKTAVYAIKIEPVTFLDVGKFDENMVHILSSLIVCSKFWIHVHHASPRYVAPLDVILSGFYSRYIQSYKYWEYYLYPSPRDGRLYGAHKSSGSSIRPISNFQM
jgi:hypothetical protein